MQDLDAAADWSRGHAGGMTGYIVLVRCTQDDLAVGLFGNRNDALEFAEELAGDNDRLLDLVPDLGLAYGNFSMPQFVDIGEFRDGVAMGLERVASWDEEDEDDDGPEDDEATEK
jgi:hypothetical protein